MNSCHFIYFTNFIICKQKRTSGDLAYVCLNGTKFYCGVYGTLEAQEQYLRIVNEWATTKRTPSISKASEVTINHLVVAFLDHAETYYVKNGRITDTYSHFVQISSRLTKLYGSLPVDKFSPVSLKTLRQLLIDDRQDKKTNQHQKSEPLSRKYVNPCIDRIRQIFPSVHKLVGKIEKLERR